MSAFFYCMKPVLVLASVIFMVLLCITFLYVNGVRINTSPSMALGIYHLSMDQHIKRGSVVAFCLPKKMALVGLKKGYLHHGTCPGHTNVLLKDVIALPGDEVVLTRNDTHVIGHHDYFTPRQFTNRQHQRVSQWVHSGVFKRIQGFWVYGRHDPIYSWDSRYYGTIKKAYLRGAYHLVIQL